VCGCLGVLGVFDGVYAWLVEHALVLTAIGELFAILGVPLALLIWGVPFFRPRTPPPIQSAEALPAVAKLTIADFLEIRRQMRADLLQELKIADPSEAVILRARVDELERQIADPEPALATALEENARLKAQLDREGSYIGAEKLADAKAAVDRLDYRMADEIFAEIEERQKIEVQIAARAVFGRGEIAEAEVRWRDAATHYTRAASLDPTPQTLHKATQFAQLAGDYARAERLAAAYLALACAGDDPETLSRALGQSATVAFRMARYVEAEGLFRQALEIDRTTIGEMHPDYAAGLSSLSEVLMAEGHYTEAEALSRQALEIDRVANSKLQAVDARHLNNLAGVVHAQGRHAEAEDLYRQALEIDRITKGELHPAFATRLNNLGNVVMVQGRHAEAEALYRQALTIGGATIGEVHPDYATRLNNLGRVVQAQGRYSDAEELFRQALEIGRATIGELHPDSATRLNNLAAVVQAQSRHMEAEWLYRQAIETDRATIGETHPNYATHLNNLGVLLAEMERFDEAREMLAQALAIRRATLPPGHPDIAGTEGHLARLP